MDTKKFPLRVLLTVTTGRLLTKPKWPDDNGIGDLYQLLDWMTNDNNFTHQLPRVMEECKPWLLRWFPELARADMALMEEWTTVLPNTDGIEKWLLSCSRHGMKPEYDVPRIPQDDHERKDPIDELASMRGTDDGIHVVTPE